MEKIDVAHPFTGNTFEFTSASYRSRDESSFTNTAWQFVVTGTTNGLTHSDGKTKSYTTKQAFVYALDDILFDVCETGLRDKTLTQNMGIVPESDTYKGVTPLWQYHLTRNVGKTAPGRYDVRHTCFKGDAGTQGTSVW